MALFFFAVDHDHAGFVKDEGARDLEAMVEMQVELELDILLL